MSRIDTLKRLAGLPVFRQTLMDCWAVWKASSIPQPTIAVWPTLRTSWALFDAGSALIKIHPQVLTSNSTIASEIIVHELAHYVARVRYGATVRPHGAEWQELVRQAGIQPRIRIPGGPSFGTMQGHRSPKVRYRHVCLVCHFERMAGSPQPRWRCAQCVDSGLDGTLTIETTKNTTKDKA